MRIKRPTVFTIAEGLLPLLDISVLLLGFFIVMFSAGILKEKGGGITPSDESSLPGIGQVILLRVEEDGKLWLSAGGKKQGKSVGLSELQAELRSVKQPKGEQEPLVLVYYDNPWRDYPEGMERQIAKAVREEGCRYARAYP